MLRKGQSCERQGKTEKLSQATGDKGDMASKCNMVWKLGPKKDISGKNVNKVLWVLGYSCRKESQKCFRLF